MNNSYDNKNAKLIKKISNELNNYSNKKSKLTIKLGILISIISIIIVITTMFGIFRGLNSAKTSYSEKESMYDQKTKAIITNIYLDENDDFDIDIEYSVDGVKYSGKLNYYSSTMYEGQEIEILYKSENPKNYYSNPFSSNVGISSIAFVFPMLFSIIILIFVLVIFVSASKKQNKKEHINKNTKLKTNGIRLIGTIKDIEIISNPKGGEPMRRIVCTYTNLQGNTVTVKSDPVYDSIELFFKERGVRTVDVYVDQNNNNYYIDVESIKR